MKSNYYVLFIFSFLPYYSFGQQRLIDSLERLYEVTTSDSTKVDLMIAMAQAYQAVKFDSSIYHSQQAVNLAEKINYLKGIADANKQMAIVHFYNADMRESQQCNARAISIYNRLKDYKGIGAIINNIGIICENRGDYEQALKYYHLGVSFRIRAGDIKGLGGSYNNIGTVYSDMGQHAESLRYLFRSLLMREMMHDKDGAAKVMGNIAGNYFSMNNLKEAKLYAMRGLRIYREQGIPDGMFQTLTVLGGVSLRQKNLGEAWRYYHEAHRIAQEIGIESNLAVAYTNLGRMSILQNDLVAAESYLKLAISLAEKVEDKMGISICLNGLGEVALKEKNYSEALRYLNKGVAISKSISNLDEVRNGSELLSEVYEKTGNLSMAMKMLKQSVEFKDSLNFDETKIRMQEAGFKYELKKKENEILHLSSERDKLIYEENIQRNNVIGLIVLLVLSFIILFLLYSISKKERKALEAIKEHQKRIEKQAANLEEINQVKDKIFSILAHDLRSPLAALVTLLELLEQKEISQGEFINIQKSLGSGTRSLVLLLDNLLNWSRSQIKGNLKAVKKEINLKTIFESVRHTYQQVSEQKNVTIEISVDDTCKVHADPDHLDIILRNLISNAIKFSNPGSKVALRGMTNNQNCIIEIEDNGLGISSEKLAKFNSTIPLQSEPGTLGERGTGLGLLLCKEFIAINNGQFKIESSLGKGSKFKLVFPL